MCFGYYIVSVLVFCFVNKWFKLNYIIIINFRNFILSFKNYKVNIDWYVLFVLGGGGFLKL